MHKKLLVFIAVLSFSFSAHSQSPVTFKIQGKIKNRVEKIIFADSINYDPITSAMSLVDQSELIKENLELLDSEKMTAVANEFLFNDRSDRSFTFTNITLRSGIVEQPFFIVDPKSKIGKFFFINRNQIHDGVVDLDEISLQPFRTLSGSVKFPLDTPDEIKRRLMITAGYKKNNGMYNSIVMPMRGAEKFSIQVPDGEYEFFFDYKDENESYFRISKDISIHGANVKIEQPIKLSPKIMNMVERKITISSVIQNMKLSDWVHTNSGPELNEEMLKENIVIMYFFADYCSPCFKEKGLKHFLNSAVEHPELTVLGIHSDSYNADSSPHSVSDIVSRIKTSSKWINLNQVYEKTREKNANTFLLWQSPEFAKKLFIDGYSTIIVFKDGIAKKIYIAPDKDVIPNILTLLDH